MDNNKITPKVSLIIPAHNEGQFVARTIEYAQKQDYPNYEIIVVNNASTDNTADVVRKFNVLLFTENNKGTNWARDRGRRESTGEILAYLDADCLPPPDWLTRGVKYFENKKVVAVSGPYEYTDCSKAFEVYSDFAQKLIYKSTNFILHVFGGGGVLIFGNTFIRKSALDHIGGLDTSITFWGDDADTAKRLSKVGKIIFDNKLTVKSSDRRFKREGVVKISWNYSMHFLRNIFKSRAVNN